MPRSLLLISGLAVILAALAARAPIVSHSQQPAAVDLIWDVAPVGVLADQRLRDALGQLVDPQAVMRDAGVNGTLRYAGTPPGPRPDQVRLLFAAAGFDQPPSQLYEARTCRFWVPAGSPQYAELVAVGRAVGRQLALGLATISLKIGPCEQTMSSADADLVVLPVSGQLPFSSNEVRPGQSFIGVDQGYDPPGTGRVAPPVTGDGGLLR